MDENASDSSDSNMLLSQGSYKSDILPKTTPLVERSHRKGNEMK